MLRKLCMVCILLGLGIGMLGCGDGKVETPKDETPAKTETPGDQTMEIKPPA